MKVSGKGVLTILLFLVGIPVIVDMILLIVIPGGKGLQFGMSGFLIIRYLFCLPAYILYLVIAFTIIKLIKNYRENPK
jgi:hypothetical protein